MDILKIKNLIHDYIDEEEKEVVRAVDNVSLNVEKGQFIAVLGHNGSGKSSLAKHINALLSPTEERYGLTEWIPERKNIFGISGRPQVWYFKTLTIRLWQQW